MDKLLEVFVRRLAKHGNFLFRTASGYEFTAGDGTGEQLSIILTDKASQVALLRDPVLTLGELYMDGKLLLEGGDVYDLHMAAQRNIMGADTSAVLRLADRMRYLVRSFKQNNNERNARSNVAHHYDLDGRLYSMFLDDDMQYSCAYFEHPQATLEEAQLAKKRHIAAKLGVEKGHSVLDIGCGWGGMGLYLANMCEAQVTGVTLSSEQLGVANKRAALQNLGSALDFRLQDYRAIKEKFDRVVSVGMLEHVGAGYLDTYFAKVADVLKDDGAALIHTIGRTDGPGVTNPWIAKYIFPGGYIPAMSEVTAAIERAGLIIADIEVLRLHYADTLREWRSRFLSRIDEARSLYDERFCRMWDFYLAGSEASFRLGQNVVFQFLLSKKVDALPVTRDYIGDREAQLRQIEPEPMTYRIAGE
jgi:cyclopropane-fatty-acyl-phospholipid synthase